MLGIIADKLQPLIGSLTRPQSGAARRDRWGRARVGRQRRQVQRVLPSRSRTCASPRRATTSAGNPTRGYARTYHHVHQRTATTMTTIITLVNQR
jgi:hypothetical protein